MNTAIIVAAGKSERMGGKVDKAFLSLGPKPVLAYSLMAFEACADIDAIIVVVRKDQVIATQGVARMFGCRKVQAVVPGGSCRQASVRNGMKECDPDTTIVSVHDAARPCITPALISETIKSISVIFSSKGIVEFFPEEYKVSPLSIAFAQKI